MSQKWPVQRPPTHQEWDMHRHKWDTGARGARRPMSQKRPVQRPPTHQKWDTHRRKWDTGTAAHRRPEPPCPENGHPAPTNPPQMGHAPPQMGHRHRRTPTARTPMSRKWPLQRPPTHQEWDTHRHKWDTGTAAPRPPEPPDETAGTPARTRKCPGTAAAHRCGGSGARSVQWDVRRTPRARKAPRESEAHAPRRPGAVRRPGATGLTGPGPGGSTPGSSAARSGNRGPWCRRR